MFFTKYTLFAGKMFLYGQKSFILKFFFPEKKTFLTEKNIKIKIYISHFKIYFYAENVCVTNKYKSFLNIYSFCKQNFF